MNDTVKFELDASRKGWRCSGCGLFINCIGLPIFGTEKWTIETKSLNWVENQPSYLFCPKCGKRIKKDDEQN